MLYIEFKYEAMPGNGWMSYNFFYATTFCTENFLTIYSGESQASEVARTINAVLAVQGNGVVMLNLSSICRRLYEMCTTRLNYGHSKFGGSGS